ncbi:MAG TPA: 16S rRNA (cytosine(967)-C(5))-methyltransferase RsmB [Polyangia bacterium]|nr:16S rRNA (cytosine(967)-C(5))-methyltransferase RsmB [Polyangia bacterium]
MKPVGARDVARRVLARVSEQAAYATLVLDAELARSELSERDRALATEITYGVLRRRSRLDRAIAAYSQRGLAKLDPRALDAARVGAYQILFLRVPAHAAVDDAVGAVKRARGPRLAAFTNAVLRRLAERGEPPLPADPLERLLTEESCPRWIYAELARLLGPDQAAALVRALSEPAPVGVRAAAGPREQVAQRIRAERPAAEITASPIVADGLLVRGAGALHDTGAYLSGLFTLQDPGAQLASIMVAPQPGERVLDACAGVGGKSMHLAQLAGDRAHIDAVDHSPQKLALLREHALRLGVGSVKAHQLDLLAPLPPALGPYDCALLDAPCSGLGTLRRHPEIKWQREANDIRDLADLQARLLATVAERVRPGGRLLYSVCTLTIDEAPAQVAAFLTEHEDWQAEGEPRITLPHRDAADGFYLAGLRRRAHS